MRHNLDDWLVEFDIPQSGGQPDSPMAGPPSASPGFGGEPNVANIPQNNMASDPQTQGDPPEQPGSGEDISDDPAHPDMPETDNQPNDFEVWKDNYFKESVKGDPNSLLDFLSPVREMKNLSAYQKKFVNDNWNIQTIRLNANVYDASKQVRKGIREQLDKNNPATSVVNHLFEVLESMPHLNNIFVKMTGYEGLKGDLHRQFLAALLGAVQVSSSPDKENIIFNDAKYAIKMPTRMSSQWGEIAIGSWTLREDDPERYLSEPELKRLQEGAPGEKDALRRRLIIESISKHFEEQAFIIQVVDEDGAIQTLGWDIANSIRGAYTEGKLIVKTRKSENSEAMIDDHGQIVPLTDIKIHYVKDTGDQTPDGEPETEEIEFLERRNGMLFLTAGLNTIRDAANSMQGTSFKETPYRGNPSDLEILRRCIVSSHDLIMKQC